MSEAVEIARPAEAPLAPLVGLVERLRAEVTELQGRWEALGEELEAKRRRLSLAEATVELMLPRQEEAKEEEEREGVKGVGAPHAETAQFVSGQASVGCHVVKPLEAVSQWSRGLIVLDRLVLLSLRPPANARHHQVRESTSRRARASTSSRRCR
jgi:hypothetical protein